MFHPVTSLQKGKGGEFSAKKCPKADVGQPWGIHWVFFCLFACCNQRISQHLEVFEAPKGKSKEHG